MTFFRTHCRHKWTYTENKTKRQCTTPRNSWGRCLTLQVLHWRSYQG